MKMRTTYCLFDRTTFFQSELIKHCIMILLGKKDLYAMCGNVRIAKKFTTCVYNNTHRFLRRFEKEYYENIQQLRCTPCEKEERYYLNVKWKIQG